MKKIVNRYLSRLGVEMHGVGYMQKLKNSKGEKSPWIKQQQLLGNKAKVVFDVGANRGNTTRKYEKAFPQAYIHAFEPFPASCKAFEKKHRDNTRIKLNKIGLSSEIGVSTMNINKSVDTNSLLESKKIGASSDRSCQTEAQMEIEISTIDEYCRSMAIDQIDILKLDVQGLELEVLKGANRMISENKIQLIYAETFFKEQYVDQALFHDIAAFLYGHNYILQDIYDPYYSAETLLWCDSLFLLRSPDKR